MTKQQVVGKFKTLSQGQYSDAVLNMMAMTFTSLCSLADFNTARKSTPQTEDVYEKEIPEAPKTRHERSNQNFEFGGLVYNIQIILPESRDPKVYDAIFKSLRDHLS